MTTRKAIDDFLGQKRLAAIGVSRNPKDFTRALYKAFLDRGYDVVPVNPAVSDVEGRPCAKRVQDIQPPVAGAIIMTRPEATEQVVRDCAEAGIGRIWLYRATGTGAVSRAALQYCQERGMSVVPGYCPMMFFPNAGFHRIHAFFMKLTGSYPR